MPLPNTLKLALKNLVNRWNAFLNEREENKWLRRLTFYQRHDRVCYYPCFAERRDLADHWFRARWYLPESKPWLGRVSFFSKAAQAAPATDEKPGCVGEPVKPADHFQLKRSSRLGLAWALLRSRHIVVWQGGKQFGWRIALIKLLGKRIAYVATGDEAGREYAEYCELLWNVLEPRMRRAVTHKSRQRFNAHVETLKKSGREKVYIFGNGPSLEEAFEFDFADGFRIMCNSVANNSPLLDHVRPDFIVAGDPVNHFGCSTYAAKFRATLLRALDDRPELNIVIPDFQGYIMLANYPEYEKRIFIIPMKAKAPNFNLLKEYRIPVYWSVLNALMIPLGCTLGDDLYTLGCDGMSPTRDNEDFWAHAKGVIDEKIDDSHRCHPTFDVHRRKHPEYVRVQLDLAQNVIRAEHEHGKRFRALNKSHMALLDARYVEQPRLLRKGQE